MGTNIWLYPEKKYQTFESFGVSGAWWAQVVGGWEHLDSKSGKPCRERIVELLFSKENGIGITCYRYNLGGGSKNSNSCTFSKGNRGAESFDANGKYDWSRDKNAVWVLKEAAKNGADEICFFCNSPPERLTKNHKSCLDRAWHENITKENYLPFAKYCFDVTEHFLAKGIPVRYLSPVNEPIWVWTEKHGQEGCHYRPRSVSALFKVFANELENRPNLKGVKLAGAENGDLRWFNKSYTRGLLKDEQIKRNLDSIDFHSYFLPLPIPFMNNRIAFMKRFRKYMDKNFPHMPLKMSEWTHMKGGRDYGIDSALVQAQIMYEDISILNVVSWQHWIAVSEVDFCDGLIYINEDTKTFEMTKRYYAFGNFSKFVTKGFVRVDVSSDDKDLNMLAFCKDDETVIIVINSTNEDKSLVLENCDNAFVHITDEKRNLEKIEISGVFVPIFKKSISTITIQSCKKE
ncbi:MAG TPA: glycoside hydrolase [Oscillospiraceae bacterium]|nr:glycoside hydrolase [Oscillospiraceae bacterium]